MFISWKSSIFVWIFFFSCQYNMTFVLFTTRIFIIIRIWWVLYLDVFLLILPTVEYCSISQPKHLGCPPISNLCIAPFNFQFKPLISTLPARSLSFSMYMCMCVKSIYMCKVWLFYGFSMGDIFILVGIA